MAEPDDETREKAVAEMLAEQNELRLAGRCITCGEDLHDCRCLEEREWYEYNPVTEGRH